MVALKIAIDTLQGDNCIQTSYLGGVVGADDFSAVNVYGGDFGFFGENTRTELKRSTLNPDSR